MSTSAEPCLEASKACASSTPTRTPVHQHAETAYLTYAMSVVKGRALPSVADGQKPVQRRILYAMRELGARAGTPYKKSARVAGDVIGKYHPHGDAACYEAAVRMAQDFTLRYPLIDGQGNFGSRDGDSAAASRYTEMRLTRFAEEILLADVDRGTVDFAANYDGTLNEPVLLPARLPVMLLNGASGIAVGMATEIPPHNLREVADACVQVIQDPDTLDEAILAAIPGPDFPCGAQVISPSADIQQVYLSGRGSVRVRARWVIEPLARGQWRVAITEIPPASSTAKVLTEIENLVNPPIKPGKKALTPEQSTLKAAALALLETVRDDSDKDHPVRILIDPRSSRVSVDDLMAFLLTHTSLEANTSVNLVSLGLNGLPKQAGVPELVREWCSFRLNFAARGLRFRLSEVDRRLHVLMGRLAVLLDIDRAIQIIREAEAPDAGLMAEFGLTQIQADDILEIRLRQLSRMESLRIEKERDALTAEKGDIEKTLASDSLLRRKVAQEIREDAKTFGDDRRTLLQPAEKQVAVAASAIIDEPVTIILSQNGYVRTRNGYGIDVSSLTWKAGDAVSTIVETRTAHPIIVLDKTGRVYNLRIQDLPSGKTDGVPVSSLVDLGAPLAGLLSAPIDTSVVLASDAGFGFICKVGDLLTRQRAGKVFLTLPEGAQPLRPALVGDETLLAFSTEKNLLIVPVDEVKILSGGGKGVTLMDVGAEKLARIVPCRQALVLSGLGKGGKPVEVVLEGETFASFSGHRARKGRLLPGGILPQTLVIQAGD